MKIHSKIRLHFDFDKLDILEIPEIYSRWITKSPNKDKYWSVIKTYGRNSEGILILNGFFVDIRLDFLILLGRYSDFKYYVQTL